MAYVNYGDYEVVYDAEQHQFDVLYQKKPIIQAARLSGLYKNGEKSADIADFKICEVDYDVSSKENGFTMAVKFKRNVDDEALFELDILVKPTGVYLITHLYDTHITGTVCNGALCTSDVFPVCLTRMATDVRSALGEAVTNIDHALYNKQTDTAVVVGRSRHTKLTYDYQNGSYTFTMPVYAAESCDGAGISVRTQVLAERYHIPFSPYNRESTFSTPPVGWMTWYAVKFRASEETVLKNARWQAEHLKDFGANTVWVDWEWYHEAFPGDRTDGVNSLKPDPKKYPNGLKYLADEIRSMGLIPSLWIGFTNEPSKNEFIEKYPDIVLADSVHWCGRYFYDFTNPHYLNEYLPTAVANVHKWGYEAVKFDTIPSSIRMHNMHRENMYDQTITVQEAYRNMVKKTRQLLGENVYMLSCSGANNASVLWGSDVFDAARVGDDIFTWQEHLDNLRRIQEFYPLHTIQFHVDADNVVLRSEYNTFEQAKSRATIISLLGLPMTFGDEFEALSEDRVDLIKRTLPILDIHPMDLCAADADRENLLINLSIAKSFESYQVTGVYNLTEQDAARTLSLCDDLHLSGETYLVYDYFRDQYLGTVTDTITLDLLPHEGRILSFRPYRGVPQVISTSRHITQGAAELTAMSFKDNTLSFTADLIQNDRYTVTVYVPEGYRLAEQSGFETYTEQENLLRLTVLPQETASHSFTLDFTKDNGDSQ